MQQIKTFEDKDFVTNPEVGERNKYEERRAARAVLTDENGHVALLHATKAGYYKLPGGGIDEGEEIEDALARELLEETGCHAKITGEIGEILEWRDSYQLKQISYCFSAKVVGEKGPLALTVKEINDGFELLWVKDTNEAIELIKSSHQTGPKNLGITFMATRDVEIVKAA